MESLVGEEREMAGVEKNKLSAFMESGIYRFPDSNSIFLDPVRMLSRNYSQFRVSPSSYYSRFFTSKFDAQPPEDDELQKTRVSANCRKRKRNPKKNNNHHYALNDKEIIAEQRHQIELHGSMHVYNHHKVGSYPKLTLSLQHLGTECFGQVVPKLATELNNGRRFLGGCRITIRPKVDKFTFSRKTCGVSCSWLTNSEIANGVFTLATAAVLPLYTLMVVAPRSELTKKTMQSSIPFTVLGLMYAYLLYLSWTPETIRFMFASKYWLPELPGIAKMFSSEMTLSSAWIHLLVVDLFAARHVYEDGLENEIETRHSVSMCLLFCPIGIVSHLITKSLSKGTEESEHGVRDHSQTIS